MMGLAKMAPDGWAYYAREIAAGVEDYFVGHGEESGRWVDRAAAGLGLSGEVDSEGLPRLFGQGLHPLTGGTLGRPLGSDKTAVVGYALSFSPPKSVSVLWALAPADIADQVRQGHDAAVAAVLEFLQDHAAFCRRGTAVRSRRRPAATWPRCSFIGRREPETHNCTAMFWWPTRSKPSPTGAG